MTTTKYQEVSTIEQQHAECEVIKMHRLKTISRSVEMVYVEVLEVNLP